MSDETIQEAYERGRRDGAASRLKPEPRPRDPGCNRHSDCAAEQAKAVAEGKPERFGPGSTRIFCCRIENCEGCFGS